MHKSTGLAIVLLSCLTACDAGSDKKLEQVAADKAQEVPAVDSSPEQKNVSTNDYAIATELLSPQVVLKDIFKQPIVGEMDQELQDGRIGTYWVGHQFSFKGKVYQVGYATSIDAVGDSTNEYPAPDEQVFVSGATYVLADDAPKLVNSQDKFAKFGANARAAIVRTNEKLETFEAGDRLLLAVPVRTLEMGGIELHSSEIFSFSVADASWSYVGNVYTGQNDDANCIDGKTPSSFPCSSSTGSLTMIEKSGSEFPDIRVARNGSEVDADKKVRRLSDKDFFEFRFNPEKSKYEQLQK
jgi:hypothetical protein